MRDRLPSPRTAAILLLMVLTVAAQAALWTWYIEDAAISFAFARNLADGYGLVTWPGGEPLEGYSNPTWVALMALFELVGVDGFWSSKLMGMAFGAATVPFAVAAARHARPDKDDHADLIAGAFLAASAQFAIWNASGLENSIVVFFMAAGTWRALVETDPRRWPLAGPIFCLLALSRPETILYAAIAGFWSMVWALQDGRGLGPTVKWLLGFFLPWSGYQAWHYWYFAWPLPNTFYAKTDANDFQPWNWSARCYTYIRGYAFEVAQGWFLPVYLAAVARGAGRRERSWLWLLLLALLATLLLPDSDVWKAVAKGVGLTMKGPPLSGFTVGGIAAVIIGVAAVGVVGPRKRLIESIAIYVTGVLAAVAAMLLALYAWDWLGTSANAWQGLRLGALGVFFLLAPLGAHNRPGGRALVLSAHLAAAALFFSAWAGGDWMKGWRWMSMLQVPASIVFAAGVATIADGLQWRIAPVFRHGSSFSILGGLTMSIGTGVIGALALVSYLPADLLEAWRDRYAIDWQVLLGSEMAVLGAGALLLIAGRRPIWAIPRERWSVPAALALLGLILGVATPSLNFLEGFSRKPETGPFSVKKRVDFMLSVAERLHLYGPVTDLDVDQGAHLWWSGFQMMDLAGLVDVPMGHHNYEKEFISQYVFEERRPELAHVHGGWASTTKIPQNPAWKQQYVEIPGYPSGKTALHVGNHVRRDLMFDARTTFGPGRRVVFDDGIIVEGWDVPVGDVGRGRAMYAEIGLASTAVRKKDGEFRVIMFLADAGGVVASWDVPPAYDWVDLPDWRPHEIFRGRFAFSIDKSVAEGTYDLGFVVIGHDGTVLAASEAGAEGALSGTDTLPRFAAGEVLFPAAIHVVGGDAVDTTAEQRVAESIAKADADDCAGADQAWRLARLSHPANEDWVESQEARVKLPLARCFARAAVVAGPTDEGVAAMKVARRWDFEDAEVVAAGDQLADALVADARAKRDAEAPDWALVYHAYAGALICDPTRTHIRREAEEARDFSLGIDEASKAAKKAKSAKTGGGRPKNAPVVEQPPKTAPEGDEGEAPAPSGPEGE